MSYPPKIKHLPSGIDGLMALFPSGIDGPTSECSAVNMIWFPHVILGWPFPDIHTSSPANN